MKRFLLTLSVLFVACVANAQVNVTLVNKTGMNLDAITIDKGKYIGTIEIDSTKTTTLAVVEFFDGIPQLNMSLQYEGKKIATHNEAVGITYLKRVTEGNYILNIFIQTDRWGSDHLYIGLQPKKVIYCGNERFRGRTSN